MESIKGIIQPGLNPVDMNLSYIHLLFYIHTRIWGEEGRYFPWLQDPGIDEILIAAVVEGEGPLKILPQLGIKSTIKGIFQFLAVKVRISHIKEGGTMGSGPVKVIEPRGPEASAKGGPEFGIFGKLIHQPGPGRPVVLGTAGVIDFD